MLTEFWKGVGSELGKKWLSYLLEPALAFWGLGLLAWVYRQDDHWKALEAAWTGTSEQGRVVILVMGILGLVASSAILQQLQLPLLRLWEGYWPRWLSGLRESRIESFKARLKPKQARWQTLKKQIDERGLTSLRQCERQEYSILDREIVLRTPPDEGDLMPTVLGNVLRAAEDAPRHRYGLDTVTVWPHLWLVLPKETQETIAEVRENLNTATRLAGWGLLAFIWLMWAWWAFIPAALLILASRLRALAAAEVYGDLLRAAFDLHRFALYEAVRWPLPTDTTTEVQHGVQLTNYLFRGLSKDPVTFTAGKGK